MTQEQPVRPRPIRTGPKSVQEVSRALCLSSPLGGNLPFARPLPSPRQTQQSAYYSSVCGTESQQVCQGVGVVGGMASLVI